MRSILYIYLCALLGGVLNFQQPQTKPVPEKKKAKVILLLDDYICSEDQWVYLHGFKDWVSGNERVIFDSAFIPKGQHRIELQGEIPFETEFKVFFSRKGPEFYIPVEPDSCVIMNVEETDGEMFYYKKAVQGKFNNEYYDYWQKTIAYRNKIRRLLAEDKKDSLEQVKAERFEFLTTRLKAAKSSWDVRGYSMINVEFPEKKQETTALAKQLAEKFPYNLSLQEFLRKKKPIPISKESRRIGEHFSALRKAKSVIDTLNLSLNQPLIIAFPDADGNKVSTKDLGVDYTLIDFWASWCKPCREEIPRIKAAIQKFPGQFKVYAVSLDANREAWQKAIIEDSTQMFKHLIGTYPNGQPSRLLRQLNIKVIPANFLIDKEQRIIAKNLRGEQLIQTLDSLMKQ